MTQVNFSPFMEAEVQRRQAELQREMELIRLADLVSRDSSSTYLSPARVLARLGTRLVALGTSLEQRYGQKPSAYSYKKFHTTSDGCTYGEMS